jgi:hypothetical protein
MTVTDTGAAAPPKTASELENEKILEEIRLNLMRSTDEYKLGRMEERQRIYGEQIAAYDATVFLTAEMFYKALSDIVPKGGILQYRIGLDYTTGVPTVLAVVPKEIENRLELIYMVASQAELIMYREMGFDRQFWAMTDECLDQELIEYDFPCLRKSV